MTRFNELGYGDVIRPRKSSTRYRVVGFTRRERGTVEVTLEPTGLAERTAPITRLMSQLVANWRMVREAPPSRRGS